MSQTPNVTSQGLNQWGPDDDIRYEQFTEDNRLVSEILDRIDKAASKDTIEIPDVGKITANFQFKLIGAGRQWKTPASDYDEPEPVPGTLMLEDGTEVKGSVMLEDGTIRELAIIPESGLDAAAE